MTREQLAYLMEEVFEEEIMYLREQGQREYAHDTSNAFANFERIAEDLDLDRKEVLWVYAMKHRDGIASYIEGHESQREDVRGRINDLIVYLFLLRGMIEEEDSDESLPEIFPVSDEDDIIQCMQCGARYDAGTAKTEPIYCSCGMVIYHTKKESTVEELKEDITITGQDTYMCENCQTLIGLGRLDDHPAAAVPCPDCGEAAPLKRNITTDDV